MTTEMLLLDMKRCTYCNQEKDLSEFGKNSRAKDGLQYRCRPCANAQSLVWKRANKEQRKEYNDKWREANKEHNKEMERAWRQNNAEKDRARTRAWAEANPYKRVFYDHRQRAKEYGVPYYTETHDWVIAEVERIYNSPCNACGATEEITLDHIIPFGRGGSDLVENWQPLCLRCNFAKHNKTMDEWLNHAN